MEINNQTIAVGTILEINGTEYEVISLEGDFWYYEDKGMVNRGEIANLHLVGDKRLGVPTPTHTLYFNNKTREFEFNEILIKQNPNIPKDIKQRVYTSKSNKIPINEISIK